MLTAAAPVSATAQGGTLFLDEIAEVPLPLQAKLLRFLESREFRPLGSTETQRFTGRLVAATNKDLRAEIVAGRFREDLLFRIEVFAITIPPLRERRGEIPALAERLLAEIASKYDRPAPLLKPDDLPALASHSFPGNVRELRNILERSLLRTPPDSRWLALDRTWIGGRAPTRATASPPPAGATAPETRIVPTDTLPPERTALTLLEAPEQLSGRSEQRGRRRQPFASDSVVRARPPPLL